MGTKDLCLKDLLCKKRCFCSNLNAQNVESVSLSSTEAHMKDLFSNQAQAFLNSLPQNAGDFKTKESIFEVTPTTTFVATPLPVHFCGAAIPTVPYEHPDSAPLRVLAKLGRKQSYQLAKNNLVKVLDNCYRIFLWCNNNDYFLFSFSL